MGAIGVPVCPPHSARCSPDLIPPACYPDGLLAWQDDGLARGLRIEELVGLFRLLELPAVGEELLDVHLEIRDDLGALGLTLFREGPGTDQRHLAAQEIWAHVERHLTALTHEAGRAPRAHRA